MILFILGTVGLFALMDRLVMGAFQRRSGPYSIGWFGLLLASTHEVHIYKLSGFTNVLPIAFNFIWIGSLSLVGWPTSSS